MSFNDDRADTTTTENATQDKRIKKFEALADAVERYLAHPAYGELHRLVHALKDVLSVEDSQPRIAADVAKLIDRLKHMPKCHASVIEMQPCNVQDVRYIGRELARLLNMKEARRG